MILLWLIVVLLGAGFACLLLAKWNIALAKWTALIALLFNLSYTCIAWCKTPVVSGPWLMDYKVDWIASWGISFHVAADGLSLLLLLLTFFLGALSVLCSWKEIKHRIGFYYFNLLWILAGISGVFVALDLFLFYFFWEMMLIPMYFFILIWGDSRRRYAAYKFFIFTQSGGLLLLLSILALYFIHAAQTGVYSYDYFMLLNTRLDPAAAKWIMMGFLIAFLIKLPAVPLHNWLPDAHSEAPTAGSLILAGLLLKTGAYGVIRFVLPMFPQVLPEISWIAMLIGVVGIVYGALLAFAQTDIKRLIAYTSVSHMGFVMLGIFSFHEMALQGVVLQLVTHGISTGALFVLAGMLKERLHTRDMMQMGGLWTSLPSMGGLALLFAMASLGLPVMGSFIAEFLILMGSFHTSEWLTVLATLGLVLSALYSLRLVQKVFMGTSTTPRPALPDLNAREWVQLLALALAIVFTGLYPQPVFNAVKAVFQMGIVK